MPPFERLTHRFIQPQLPFHKKGQLVLGILLIIAATLTVVCGVVSVSLPTYLSGFYGTPLWTGAVIMIGGLLSVYSSRYDDNICASVSGLVMNILSIICAFILIILNIFSASLEVYENHHCGYDKPINYNGYDISYNDYGDCKTEKNIDIAIFVLGVIELGLTIAAVNLLSMDVCCCSTSQHGMEAMLMRNPAEPEIQDRYSQVVVTAGANQVSHVQYPPGQPQQYPAAQPQNYPAENPSYGAPQYL